LITLLVIVIRIAWIFPNTFIPRLLSKKIRTTEPKPTWQNVLVVGWSGMRGVVSLASGLAIPLTLSNNTPFPHRDLILFITFILILVTLVFQGLTLPWLIKILKVRGEEDDSQQELAVRLILARASLEHMDRHYSELADNDAYIRVKDRYARMIDIAAKRLNTQNNEAEAPAFLPKYRQMLIDLVAIKRNELNKMRHNNSFPDELIRKKELELDLEEARLHKS
jgi:CPA1 family monovalent cation:H+ antiporter